MKNNPKNDESFVSSMLVTRASQELEDEIQDELIIPDPSSDKAQAALNKAKHKNTK